MTKPNPNTEWESKNIDLKKIPAKTIAIGNRVGIQYCVTKILELEKRLAQYEDIVEEVNGIEADIDSINDRLQRPEEYGTVEPKDPNLVYVPVPASITRKKYTKDNLKQSMQSMIFETCTKALNDGEINKYPQQVSFQFGDRQSLATFMRMALGRKL